MTTDHDALKAGGIDFEQALERFGGNEALYRRLSAKFVDDPHFAELEAALEHGDADAAQRAAHSLKGVAGNLSFGILYDVSCRMNDNLRNGDVAAAQKLMPELRSAYEQVCATLKTMAS